MTEHRAILTDALIGCPVVTADGTQLGTVKELAGNSFKVNAPLQPDYWLSLDCVTDAATDQLTLSFPEANAEQYRMSQPDMTMTRAETETTERAAMPDRTAPTEPRTGDLRTEEGRTLELKEEELRVEKERVQAGEVTVRTDVVEDTETFDVPVRREEVYIERRPVSGERPASGEIREGEEIRVPVTEERVSVSKEPVVREEVAIGKRQVDDAQRVSDSVRREEAHLERDGDVEVREEGTNLNQPPPPYERTDPRPR